MNWKLVSQVELALLNEKEWRLGGMEKNLSRSNNEQKYHNLECISLRKTLNLVGNL